jgi:hypothetical protein
MSSQSYSSKRASGPTAEDTREIINQLETYSKKLEGFGCAQNLFVEIANDLRAKLPVRPATI